MFSKANTNHTVYSAMSSLSNKTKNRRYYTLLELSTSLCDKSISHDWRVTAWNNRVILPVCFLLQVILEGNDCAPCKPPCIHQDHSTSLSPQCLWQTWAGVRLKTLLWILGVVYDLVPVAFVVKGFPGIIISHQPLQVIIRRLQRDLDHLFQPFLNQGTFFNWKEVCQQLKM